MQLSGSYVQIVIIWSIRIVRFSVQSSDSQACVNKWVRVLNWNCQYVIKACLNVSFIEPIYEKLRRICGILAGIREKKT